MALSIIGVALLFFLGHALGWFFEKTKIPDLLLLVIIGYILGPTLGILKASDFGKVGAIVSTLALVVILYEGGLHLTAKELAQSFLSSSIVAIMGFVLIVIVATFLAYTLGGQSLNIALLLGVGIGSTSSAIVIPMVKPLSISDKTKTILSLESAITDVLAIVLFLVLVDGIVKNSFSPSELLIKIGPNTLLAMGLGIASGLVWAFFKKTMPAVFKMAFAGEAWALLSYGVIEKLGFNGAIGVLSVGFTLANLNLLPTWFQSQLSRVPVSYKELSLLKELTFLLKTFFFIYLGVLIKFSNLKLVALAFLISVFIFITRWIVVQVCFRKSNTSLLDAMVSTAMGPRGLACAVLATIPLQKGIAGGDWLRDIIFALIPISIFITALMVFLFENPGSRRWFSGLWSKFDTDTTKTIADIDHNAKNAIE